MTQLTDQELLDRVRALVPKIAERAPQCELERTPNDDTIRELSETGVYSLLVPKRWGGPELSLATHIQIVEMISAACTSTGWVSCFYMGHNWMATKMSEQAQGEIFGERPYGRIPVTTSPPVKAKAVAGGWEISGRASWASGIMHADWVWLSGLTEDKQLKIFMMPPEDVQVHDVWRMSGMAGTGSNDVEVDGVFIPEYRSQDSATFFAGRTAGSAIHENPLYQMPLLPFVYCEAVPVLTGGLRGAASAFAATLRRRVTSHAQTVVKDQQHTHILYGESETNALVAEALMRELHNQTMDCLQRNTFSVNDRLRLKSQAAFLVQHCRQSVTQMMSHAGTTSFQTDHPLQRYFRDLTTLSTHAFWNWDTTRESVGRDQLGLELNNPLV